MVPSYIGMFGIVNFFRIGSRAAFAFQGGCNFLSISISVTAGRILGIFSMHSHYSLIFFYKVITRFCKSKLLGIPESPIPGSVGSPPVSPFLGVFVRSILGDAGALALTATVKIIKASLICCLYVLYVFVNFVNCAVLEVPPGTR